MRGRALSDFLTSFREPPLLRPGPGRRLAEGFNSEVRDRAVRNSSSICRRAFRAVSPKEWEDTAAHRRPTPVDAEAHNMGYAASFRVCVIPEN
jgi:hypothetical protein